MVSYTANVEQRRDREHDLARETPVTTFPAELEPTHPNHFPIQAERLIDHPPRRGDAFIFVVQRTLPAAEDLPRLP